MLCKRNRPSLQGNPYSLGKVPQSLSNKAQMCFFWGKPSSISKYLVLKLPSWLQVLHGQEVVHEVHVRGHLQECSLGADSRKTREELLQIFHNFRADKKQDDRKVWLISYSKVLHSQTDEIDLAQHNLFYFSPKFTFLPKILKQAEGQCVESGCLPLYCLGLGITLLH